MELDGFGSYVFTFLARAGVKDWGNLVEMRGNVCDQTTEALEKCSDAKAW